MSSWNLLSLHHDCMASWYFTPTMPSVLHSPFFLTYKTKALPQISTLAAPPFPLLPSLPSSPFCFPSSQRRGIKSGREGTQGTVIWKENEERNGMGSTRRQGTSEKVLAGLWVLELQGWTVMALLWCLRHPLTLVWDSQGVSPLCEYCSGLQGDSSCWLSATIPLPAVPWKISACSHAGTPVLACTHWYRLSLYEAH